MDCKNLIPALIKAQLKFPPILKDGTNPHFRSKYLTYDTIVNAVKEPLASEGLTISHQPKLNGTAHVMVTRLLHVSGEFMESEFPYMVEKPTGQGMGSANTYAKRQSLCNILAIASDEDDDGNAAEKLKRGKEVMRSDPPSFLTKEQILQIKAMAPHERVEKICKFHKVNSLEMIESKHFESILRILNVSQVVGG